MPRRKELSVARSEFHGVLKFRAPAKVQPPDLVALLHLVVDTSKDPDASVRDPASVVVTRNESPGARPGQCLEVEVADVVQNAVVSCLTATDVESVIVYDCRMAGSTTWNWTVKFGLRPVRCFKIEDYDIGKMLTVFVLTAEDQELGALPEACRVS